MKNDKMYNNAKIIIKLSVIRSECASIIQQINRTLSNKG